MINFFYKIDNFTLKFENRLRRWILFVSLYNFRFPVNINYIFVDETEILYINNKFLEHDYYTDILTFDYSSRFLITADIYISVPTVKYNSDLYETTFCNELYRVIIHGILHLLGYNDKTNLEKKRMRILENKYLKMIRTYEC